MADEQDMENGSGIEDFRDFFEQKSGEDTDPRIMVMIAKNLNMIKENAGIVVGDQADLGDINLHAKAKDEGPHGSGTVGDGCVADNEQALTDWLAQHYNDYEMAFMIALAVFGKTPYLWVYSMAESLFYRMEKVEKEPAQQMQTVPSTLRLQTIGGLRYQDYVYNHMGKVESEFICFQKSEYADRVLWCVWNEFIFFRKTLVDWLAEYVYDQNYTKNILAVEALAKLASFDFDYFNQFVVKVFFDKREFKMDFAVAQIMSHAYRNEKYRDNIDKLYKYWSTEGNPHFSLTALMLGVDGNWGQEKMQIAVEGYFDNLMHGMNPNVRENYKMLLPVFYTIGERKTAYFKAAVTVLYDKLMLYRERKHRTKRSLVGLVFFWLLEIDDMQSNVDVNRQNRHKDMIFVKMCLMENETAPKVQELWRYLWTSKSFHKLVKTLLQKYLYQYGGCSEKDIAYLRCFLYSFQDDKSSRDDMEYFLKKISIRSNRPIRAAERINHQQ